MSTTIRLTRMGRKQRPFYRLVVVDSRNRRDGAYIDALGTYNPMTEHYECDVDAGRAIAWLEKGATCSATAKSLLRNEGVLYRWHLQKSGVPAEQIDPQVEEFRSKRATVRSAAVAQAEQARLDKVRAEAEAAAKQKADEQAAAQKAREEELAAAAAASAEAEAKAKADEASAEGEAAETPADADGDAAEGEEKE